LLARQAQVLKIGETLTEQIMAAAYDTDNIFARILRGELPCEKVYEDGGALAVMDIAPRSKGHVLVITKQASRNLLDADDTALVAALSVARKVANAAMTAFKADGVMLAQFSEAPAGQTVFHLHFHVIPRYLSEPLKPAEGPMEDKTVLADLARQLRLQLQDGA
jgi:diadenosine tetraphosphate (Ap4A) HIT family hydrolase